MLFVSSTFTACCMRVLCRPMLPTVSCSHHPNGAVSNYNSDSCKLVHGSQDVVRLARHEQQPPQAQYLQGQTEEGTRLFAATLPRQSLKRPRKAQTLAPSTPALREAASVPEWQA